MSANKSVRESNSTAHLTTLNNLIAVKQASVGPEDGRLQVALAIAATTNLVTVNATETPFTTTPDDLFDLMFNDSTVGISDEQMPVFKANLTVLLPTIAIDISQIPENAGLPIEKVAELVRLF